MSDNDILAAIGHRIRARRKVVGITQSDLAEATGVSRGSIANIELGDQAVQVHRLAAIAQALGCTIAHLLGEGAPAELPRIRVRTVSSVECEKCGVIGRDMKLQEASHLKFEHARDHMIGAIEPRDAGQDPAVGESGSNVGDDHG